MPRLKADGTPFAPATTTCRYHCASCGEHFASLDAFDHHRQGPYDGDRYCELPEIVRADKGPKRGRRLLEPKTRAGECRIGGSAIVSSVTIWACV